MPLPRPNLGSFLAALAAVATGWSIPEVLYWSPCDAGTTSAYTSEDDHARPAADGGAAGARRFPDRRDEAEADPLAWLEPPRRFLRAAGAYGRARDPGGAGLGGAAAYLGWVAFERWSIAEWHARGRWYGPNHGGPPLRQFVVDGLQVLEHTRTYKDRNARWGRLYRRSALTPWLPVPPEPPGE